MVVAARFLLTDVGLKGGVIQRSTIGLAAFTSALFLLAFAPSISVAQKLEATISAQSNDFDAWKYMFHISGIPQTIVVHVNPGDYLIFSNASGEWGEGDRA